MLRAAFLIATLTIWSAAARADQPNVLLIITDDQGYGDVGFHGNEMIQTPSIDALARQSLRLTNFHVEPTCAETRAALMSGKFPFRVGVWHTILGRSIMRAESVTMPDLFSQAGYRTGMFGKWHLGDNYPYRPQDRGFETTLNHGGGGVGQTPDVWGNDYFDDVYLANGELTPVRGYCTDQFFDAAKDFIAADDERPFFCYLATNTPHSPFVVDQSYKKPYIDQGVAEPMASFYGMISNIDENIGSMLEMLSNKHLLQDTIILFMTDNGTAAGHTPQAQSDWKGFNAGMRGKKGAAYDGGHRVPCFIRFPDGSHADTQFNSLTAHVDLLPTLAQFCEIDSESAGRLDGVDLLRRLGQQQPANGRTLIVQSHRRESPRQWTKSAVLTDNWRLVNGNELYAINDDPGQQNDVASQNPSVVQKLRDAYQSWWEDCAPDPTNFSRIVIGHESTPRVLLTGHDWHGPAPPWNQTIVKRRPTTNGTWQLEVAQPGWYQFLLARQPLEEPVGIDCEHASIAVGATTVDFALDPRVVLAPVTMQLNAGATSLRTTLHSSSSANNETGAFFVYVNYLGESKPTVADLPSWLSAGDRIGLVGGTLFERLQETGSLEAEFLSRLPTSGITMCNIAWSGDTSGGRARAVFGTPSEGKSRRGNDIDLAAPSVLLVAYGMSEALNPEVSFQLFKDELLAFVLEQKNGGRQVVLCDIPNIEHDAQIQTGVPWAEIIPGYSQRRSKLNAAIDEIAQQTSDVTPTYRIELPSLQTKWFESAQYVSSTGYEQWSRAFAESATGLPAISNASKLERLRTLAVKANHSFFELHRPQNETYLYLFRKHEQGNNGVEPGQHRPLLADQQWQMLFEAAR